MRTQRAAHRLDTNEQHEHVLDTAVRKALNYPTLCPVLFSIFKQIVIELNRNIRPYLSFKKIKGTHLTEL